MNKWNDVPKNNSKVILLRRKELGNNCKFIADAYGPDMSICMPDEVPPDAEVIIRWGTTTNLPRRDHRYRKVLNMADAIHQTSNKRAFRLLADKHGLTSKTWPTLKALQADDEGAEAIIIRPSHHERSKDIFLCRNLDDVKVAMKKIEGDEYYISEYIPKDRELRVFVAFGRAFMVFEKVPKNKADVSWGCVEEGSLKYINWSDWPIAAVTNAIKAFNLSNLHFGAADIMMKGDKAYFLEYNTAPEVWPYYGQRFADVFHYHIDKNKYGRIPVETWDNWKGLIHPALSDKAV